MATHRNPDRDFCGIISEMRKDTKYRILENLLDGAFDMVDLFAAISTSGYGASRKTIEKRASKVRESREAMLSGLKISNSGRNYKNFANILYKLKSDGLIYSAKGKLTIAQAGREALGNHLPRRDYQSAGDGNLKIIIFDVPEKYSSKRKWLRRVLLSLGFSMLQKSVWAGKKRLPVGFLEDLKETNLIDYVDIFEITKKGTMQEIV